MTESQYAFLDTDLSFYRISTDKPVAKKANEIFEQNRPTAMSAFSLLELKGNYIADLIFLHKKISASDTLLELFHKIKNIGGRRVVRMLEQLWFLIDRKNGDMEPWGEAKNALLTHLDAQIDVAWLEFEGSVDKIFDDFACNRASEEPEEIEGAWNARIGRCRKANTNCGIVEFMRKYSTQLKALVDKLNKVTDNDLTKELKQIKHVCKETISKNRFPWEENICRSVGDLLIGLQSKSGKTLISSNKKEHGFLHEPLEYNFTEFPISEIRSK